MYVVGNKPSHHLMFDLFRVVARKDVRKKLHRFHWWDNATPKSAVHKVWICRLSSFSPSDVWQLPLALAGGSFRSWAAMGDRVCW